MEQLPKRKPNRLAEYDYNAPGAYFLTLCTEHRKCTLSRIPVGTGVLDGPTIELLPYGKIADKFLRQLDAHYETISVDSYVIMPNHIHILLSVFEQAPTNGPAPTPQNSVVSRFVSTFTRFCNNECGQNIWQSRFYDHIIRDRQDYDARLRYIHDNPFRWLEDELFSMD